MQDLNELYAELTRDILDQARDIEAGVAQPHLVVDKLEQFIKIIGVISALSNQDFDPRVTANLQEVIQRFSSTTQPETPGPGRPT